MVDVGFSIASDQLTPGDRVRPCSFLLPARSTTSSPVDCRLQPVPRLFVKAPPRAHGKDDLQKNLQYSPYSGCLHKGKSSAPVRQSRLPLWAWLISLERRC